MKKSDELKNILICEPYMNEYIEEYKELRKKALELSMEMSKISMFIRDKMGNNEKIIDDDNNVLVTNYIFKKHGIDDFSLKNDFPQIYETYLMEINYKFFGSWDKSFLVRLM